MLASLLGKSDMEQRNGFTPPTGTPVICDGMKRDQGDSVVFGWRRHGAHGKSDGFFVCPSLDDSFSFRFVRMPHA